MSDVKNYDDLALAGHPGLRADNGEIKSDRELLCEIHGMLTMILGHVASVSENVGPMLERVKASGLGGMLGL